MNAPIPTLSQRIASYRLPRITTPRMSRQKRLQALPWAVWLGANTAPRLAEEWQMPPASASYWLKQGVAEGILRARKPSAGRIPTIYRVVRLEVGMRDRSKA